MIDQVKYLEGIIDELGERVRKLTLESSAATTLNRLWKEKVDELQNKLDEMNVQEEKNTREQFVETPSKGN